MKRNHPKIQVQSTYQSHHNSFSVVEIQKDRVRAVTWDKCRESFCLRMNTPDLYKNDTKNFLFHSVYMENVKGFIREFEKRLRLKGRTIFAETSRSNCFLIRPNKFWLTEPMKMGLLTILLRCGANYKGVESFDATIESYIYGEETVAAINRFLQGYTKCVVPVGFSTLTSPWRDLFLNGYGLSCLVKESKDEIPA